MFRTYRRRPLNGPSLPYSPYQTRRPTSLPSSLGESFGLLSEAGKYYDKRLDNKEIHDTIEKVLLCIQSLFKDAETLTEHYGLRPYARSRRRDSKSATTVFTDSFARFEDKMRETQE
jgi:hypothetical protein